MSVANTWTAQFLRAAATSSISRMAREYASSPDAQPGTQTRNGSSACFASTSGRMALLTQFLERLGVAEERRDVDQQVLEQLADLMRRPEKAGRCTGPRPRCGAVPSGVRCACRMVLFL